MPLIQRVVDPIYLSRKPLESNVEIDAIFINVSNNTLCSTLRQLASVVTHASEIFLEISEQLEAVKTRTENLKRKVGDVDEKVKKYNPKSVPVPEWDLNSFRVFKNHYECQKVVCKNLFEESSRTRVISKMYEEASQTPVRVMKQMDALRRDGLLCSSLFVCTPVIGERKVLLRNNWEIETRKPRILSQLDNWNSEDELLDDPFDGVGMRRLRHLERANSSGSLHKLPSPQQRIVAVSSKYPSSVIPVDISGTGFNRMTQFRRSLIHFEFSKKRKKKRNKRRNTIASDRDIQLALKGTESDVPCHSLSVHQLKEEPALKVSDRVESDPESVVSASHNVYALVGLDDKLETAAVPLAFSPAMNITVKLRENMSKTEKEENRSSSGNWSGSGGSGNSSTRASLESTSHGSVGRDSALSDGSDPSARAAQSSQVTTRRWLNSLETSYSSDGSERTLTPEVNQSQTLVDDLETVSAHSCDTEGYYTSFHSDSGLRQQERPLTAEAEYELFGRGSNRSTDTTNSSTSTVVMNPVEHKRPAPAPPPRGSSLERRKNKINQDERKRASVITVIDLLAEHVPEESSAMGEEHKDDSSTSSRDADSGRETSSSPCVTDRNVVSPEMEFSESDLDGPERQERLRVKTVMDTSRIPSMCVITPPQSDEESGKSDIVSPNDPTCAPRLSSSVGTTHIFPSTRSPAATVHSKPLETHFDSSKKPLAVREGYSSRPESSTATCTASALAHAPMTLDRPVDSGMCRDQIGPQAVGILSIPLAHNSQTKMKEPPCFPKVTSGKLPVCQLVKGLSNLTDKVDYISVSEVPKLSSLPSTSYYGTEEKGLCRSARVGARVTLDSEGKVVYSSDSLKKYPRSHSSFEPGPHVRQTGPAPASPISRPNIYIPYNQQTCSAAPSPPGQRGNAPGDATPKVFIDSSTSPALKTVVNGTGFPDGHFPDGKVIRGYPVANASWSVQPELDRRSELDSPVFYPSRLISSPTSRVDLGYGSGAVHSEASLPQHYRKQPTNTYQRFSSPSSSELEFSPVPGAYYPVHTPPVVNGPCAVSNIEPHCRYASQAPSNGLENDNAYQQRIAQFQSALPVPQQLPHSSQYQVNSPKNRKFRLFGNHDDSNDVMRRLHYGSLDRRQIREMKNTNTPLRTSSPLSKSGQVTDYSVIQPFPSHLNQSPVPHHSPREISPLCRTNSLPRNLNRSVSPSSDSSSSSISRKKCSMTSEEIYTAIYRSKKKLGIRSDFDFSSSPSPTSTRSNSPSLSSTSSLLSLNSVSSRNSSSEMGFCPPPLNKRNSWSPDTYATRDMLASPTLSEPGSRHSVATPFNMSPNKFGPKTQTSIMDFKKLLLKHKSDNRPKISAVELLKPSTSTPQQSTGPRTTTPSYKPVHHKQKVTRHNAHSLRYPSASLRALLMSPGTDVISMPIMEEMEQEKDLEHPVSSKVNSEVKCVDSEGPCMTLKGGRQAHHNQPVSSHNLVSRMEERNGKRWHEGVDDMAILSVLQSIKKAQSTLAAVREAHSAPRVCQSPMETSL